MSDHSQQISLLNFSGSDRLGLMAALTSALAASDAQILDVGQAIVHDQLVLSLLTKFAHEGQREQAIEALSALAREREVTFEHQLVGTQAYDDWVQKQGQPRYILTLLADGLLASQLTALSAVVAEHGLNIQDISRLSNRLSLRDVGARRQVSVEMTLRGSICDEQALKSALLGAAGAHDFDCSVQLDSVYRRNRRLVAFDMDSTLIRAEVIDELARRHGVYEEVARVTARAMAGEIDFVESFRARVALLKGMPRRMLDEVAESVELSQGAQLLIDVLHHFGYTTAILSGGFRYVGESLQRKLAIDHVYANELEFAGDVATGGVVGEIVDADAKANLLRELCQREGISTQQAIAIGDGANDLPMLATAGLGIAFHAKPLVQATASHAISRFGLDSLLYLLGFSQRELEDIVGAQ